MPVCSGHRYVKVSEHGGSLGYQAPEILEKGPKFEYFVYRDGQGLGSMTRHLAYHCFSFNMRWI